MGYHALEIQDITQLVVKVDRYMMRRDQIKTKIVYEVKRKSLGFTANNLTVLILSMPICIH